MVWCFRVWLGGVCIGSVWQGLDIWFGSVMSRFGRVMYGLERLGKFPSGLVRIYGPVLLGNMRFGRVCYGLVV